MNQIIRTNTLIPALQYAKKTRIFSGQWALFLLVMQSVLSTNPLFSQTENPVLKLFPQGTILHGNIAYNQNGHAKQVLDIYTPPNAVDKLPVVLFIHGGGWLVNDKYADIGYMGNTLSAIINSGIAIVSIDYRFASQAQFPAQIQDSNRALAFLLENADAYNLDTDRIALMGFSAGGYLAALQGLANNNDIPEFFMESNVQRFAIKAVVDYYGPSELTGLASSEDEKAPEAILLGAAPIARPDLAKTASPVTYVDKNDPPFLILHGEKDDVVTNRQSKLLSGWLTAMEVKNELIIVKDAPHYGKMYDVDELKTKVVSFLKTELQVSGQ